MNYDIEYANCSRYVSANSDIPWNREKSRKAMRKMKNWFFSDI